MGLVLLVSSVTITSEYTIVEVSVEIPEAVLITLVGSTTASVLGLFGFVAKYLYSEPSP